MDTSSRRDASLPAWQWALYSEGHQDRRNLLVHALTAPLFMAGTVALASSPVTGLAAGLSGVVAMVGAVAAQGRGHKEEANRPVPFRGPGDVVARLFLEQWVTFPRYVLSGRFAQAWRGTRRHTEGP